MTELTDLLKNHAKETDNRANMVLVTVNADLASHILLHYNTHNRPLTKSVRNQYSRDILAHDWESYKGLALMVSTEGWLEDGQHRLAGLVDASYYKPDVTIDWWFQLGVPPSFQRRIDVGPSRTLAQFLIMDKMSPRGLAGPASSIATEMAKFFYLGGPVGLAKKDNRVSMREKLMVLDDHPILCDKIPQVTQKGLRNRFVWTPQYGLIGSRPGVYGAAYYITYMQSSDHTERFRELLGKLDELHDRHPVKWLVRTAHKQAYNTRKYEFREPARVYYAWFTAWNAWIEGREIPKNKLIPADYSSAIPEPEQPEHTIEDIEELLDEPTPAS